MQNIIHKNNKTGYVLLIIGCMFAGKTEEFIRRLVRFQYGKYKVIVFKPYIDNRYSIKETVSHSNLKIAAINVKESKEILNYITSDVDVIGIDELQFFDFEIVNIINQLANQGLIVIANGLDKDFKNDPFLNIQSLIFKAEYIYKLHAICVICGNDADRTQRLINNKPAKKNDPIILIGASESYQARCRLCHIIDK